MDELTRRVYGADHDDPGPEPGCDYVDLVAGPLDGLLLNVTGWTGERLRETAILSTEIGRHGPGGHTMYGPRPGDPGHWDWRGDTP
ncbi:hypothetical protein POF50_015205 [Streptomyces sp. SL13]|uniref:Uncharacterized protein n=1 Tax=Streptantibioticus silvisoli TaxID=2705255 RepID=A0AA90GZW0_9ACTN|nr:hypothetical protein [Streptantibioticus silvisoli]MDI5970674.1 hypothetical protein [Streptantibioticus silvisoli]